MGMSSSAWPLAGLLISAAFAARGLKSQSLSRAGAAAAFLVGSVHMLCGPRFGITLLAFYLTSSKLTKYKTEVKAEVEEDYKRHGQRSPVQVLSNSLGGCLTALLARLLASSGSSSARDAALLAFLGHYACCCADTWSSELGILSRSPPRLITTGRVVPRGTNGGVSLLGTAAGAAGGLAMGAVFWAAGPLDAPAGRLPGAWLPALGALLGLAGTAADSLLGATCQYTGHSERLQRVVGRPGPGVRHVSGRRLLSNDAVNVAAAAVTAAAGAALGLALAPGR